MCSAVIRMTIVIEEMAVGYNSYCTTEVLIPSKVSHIQGCDSSANRNVSKPVNIHTNT